MKKLLFTLLICLSFTINSAFAGCDKGFIKVSSTVEDEIAPNFATFNIQIITTNKNKKVAVSENSQISEELINIIKEKLYKNEDIKTTSYALSPVYVYDKNTNKQKLDNYKVINRLQVSIVELSRIGDLMDLAIKNGATNVDGLNFSIKSDDNQYYYELLKKACELNLKKADFVAKSMGEKLGKTKKIEIIYEPTNYLRQSFMKTMSSENTTDNSINIETGSVKVNATINSEFYLK